MNVLIISGSQRVQSNSAKLSQWVKAKLGDLQPDANVDIMDLSHHLELIHHYSDLDAIPAHLLQRKEALLQPIYDADAFVFVVPEWGGLPPPILLNTLLLCANGSAGGLPLGHKPGFIVGVSESGGGSNPISVLKGHAAKNTHITWIPLHTIVPNVSEFLQQTEPLTNSRLSQVAPRLALGLECLMEYAEVLKPVRHKLVSLSQVHPFGQ